MSDMNESWKNKALIVGGLIGAMLGVGAAVLYVRVAEESGGPRQISAGQAVKLAVATLAVVRQASELGG